MFCVFFFFSPAFTYKIKDLAATLETITGKAQAAAYDDLLCSIKSTMTDQGPTMPQFSKKLQCIQETLLPTVVKNWETCPVEVENCIAQFGTFYCKMHPLINFAEEINKVLKSFKDITTSGKNAHTLATSKAEVTRLIRTASKVFHNRGSDQSGAEDIFSSYLENECGTFNHFPYYVGKTARANIIFESAAATYYDLDHMIGFVKSLPEPTIYSQAVAEDASGKIHKADLRALGILYKSVTDPLWHVIKTAENVLSLNGTLHLVQQKLEKWATNVTDLFHGERVLPDVDVNKDEVYERLFTECIDPEMEVLCIQALEMSCSAVLLILNRQCQDQLPGGRYWNLPAVTVQQYTNVPSTNMIGERDFAALDCLVRQKPNVRAIHLESLIMWSHNGKQKWLDTLDLQTKKVYMQQARAHAPEMLEKYRERSKVKKQRWENLQIKQQKKKEKEQKKIQDRVKLTNDVIAQGAVWTSKEEVERCFQI